MGSKRFGTLNDFARHGFNIHLTCANGHCPNEAVLDAWQAVGWAQCWRWPLALEAGVMDHFVCSKCRARSPHPRPTQAQPTLNTFFPEDEMGWKSLRQRIGRLKQRRVR